MGRIANLSMKITPGAPAPKNIENEGRPRGVIENKGDIKRHNVGSRWIIENKRLNKKADELLKMKAIA
jgi:hypothetical protein